jgi:UDP-N-acetylmuramoyl-L-alanyl-D-glutamate--2,6-diaminopimelate ligase
MLRKLKNFAHLCLAILANVMYGFPAKKLTVIGVTGTDGKTTTSTIIYHILKSTGHKTALITTVGAYINNQMHSTGFHVTTPSAFAIQKFINQAAKSGHEYVVIETSSHGIDQNRIWGIPYKIAAITNITHEHLDYHVNFNAYIETKFKLLKRATVAVVNLDDAIVKNESKKLNNRVIGYSLHSPAEVNLSTFPFESKLFGSFNQSNCLAAIAVCKELGVNDEQIRTALMTIDPPPGRQDIIWNDEFKVMVDFAHTPNSIETILREAKQTNPKRLIHLFGAPGRRDQAKRKLMGESSAKYADVIVIAPDDPRDESIDYINGQIRSGLPTHFKAGENLFEFKDRLKALEFTLSNAQAGDFIVLTGKGHEPTLALADKELPWNEKELALNILQKMKPQA